MTPPTSLSAFVHPYRKSLAKTLEHVLTSRVVMQRNDRAMIADTKGRGPVVVFLGLAAASLAALLLLPPILQDQSYHRFADERTVFGIPNFWNVVSNHPFAAVGAVGLRQFYRDPATSRCSSGYS